MGTKYTGPGKGKTKMVRRFAKLHGYKIVKMKARKAKVADVTGYLTTYGLAPPMPYWLRPHETIDGPIPSPAVKITLAALMDGKRKEQ